MKKYFVFTDSENARFRDESNVTIIPQNKMGWPYDTLNRFDVFLKSRALYLDSEYLFFFNANAKIVSEIFPDILPEEEGLVGVQHPCHYGKNPDEYIYERNQASLAYVPYGSGSHYFMGSFNGGKTEAYLKMCEDLKSRIDIDTSNNIIALWHDESHLNRYFLDHRVKALSSSYAYPEELELPFEKKILLRDKHKYGGHNFLREVKEVPAIRHDFRQGQLLKYFNLSNYVYAFKWRIDKFRKEQGINKFIKNVVAEDERNARILAVRMEKPFEEISLEVSQFIESNGVLIEVRHKLFNYAKLPFDLSDNFQMAICREFFIDNAYDLNKLNFIPKHVIDCGAYRGYFSLMALNSFPFAEITAIEAHPDNYKKMSNDLSLNHVEKIKLVHAAVSASGSEEVTLFFGGSNGSLENWFSKEGEYVRVKTVNLNHFIDENYLLLKVDIEGAELEFFPEIIQKLSPTCAVFLETHDGWHSLQKIKEKFVEEGFKFEVLHERDQCIDSFAQRLEIDN